MGRRGTLFVGAVVFTIGGAVQTFTLGFWSMIVGRIISGFGVGLLSYVIIVEPVTFHPAHHACRTIVPIYQSEVSPADHVRHSSIVGQATKRLNPPAHFSGAHWHVWSLPAIFLDMRSRS
jgi:MFS family permease